MGFDFLLDQSQTPYLLEINRHLGYPIIDKPEYNPRVRAMALEVTSHLVKDFLEPTLQKKPYQPRDKWQHLLTI